MTTAKQTALNDEAMALFDVKSEKTIQTALYALGFRQPCNRCGGSGHYSYNQMTGTICFGCNGKKFVSMKLTRKILDEAKVKVDAGELVRIREVGAARVAARKTVDALEPAIQTAYDPIGDAYTIGSRASRTIAESHDFVKSPIFFAQTMNNSLRRAFWDLQRDLKYNQIEARLALCKAEEILELLVQLRDAWFAFDAEKNVSMEDAERDAKETFGFVCP